ncbi:hypothetical protein Elgi_38560 [Paenibacillus elgii]|uniref:hypothetical protein n=1 Tax=Paenibacillus elgii TaxID=189691 RepID=UPI002D7DE8AA|nr:hypothetical protein Elgi_38560 [Paenibacillus elgii]
MISKKQLNKISEDINQYYSTDEIDIDLANRIHDHCYVLLHQFKAAIELLDDALTLLDDVHCGDTNTYKEIAKFIEDRQ